MCDSGFCALEAVVVVKGIALAGAVAVLVFSRVSIVRHRFVDAILA